MSRTFFYIYNSPSEFFNKIRSKDWNEKLFGNGCGSSDTFLVDKKYHKYQYPMAMQEIVNLDSSKDGSFSGSFANTLSKFDNSEFSSEAALTDEIIQNLNTADFNELKWKFVQHLEEGDEIDIERFLGGSDKCWNGSRRVPRTKKTVRIYVNFGGNCDRSNEELAVAGSVGVTLAETMESMGINAEIWAVQYGYGEDTGGNNYLRLIKLKQSNEYADTGLVNFFLGDYGVFRNALFRHIINDSTDNGFDVSFGLGSSETADLSMIGLTESERKTAILVPQIFRISKAKEWLEDVLCKDGNMISAIYDKNIVDNE